nr:translation initiation factor IF-2 [Ktedonobacteraceae bacterium]
MRNTSESPDANEQAKTTTPKPRTTARSKSVSASTGTTENASTGSQEQEKKPATRRRTTAASATTSASTNGTAISPPPQGEKEHIVTPSETPTKPTSAQHTTRATSATSTTNTPSETPTRPTATQRTTSAINTPSETPTRPTPQRSSGSTNVPTQRPGGTTNTPTQRSSGSTNAPSPRPVGVPAPAPRYNGPNTQQGQRPGGPGTSNRRTGGPANPGYRPQNVQGGTQYRQGTYNNGPTQQHTQYPPSQAGQPRPAGRTSYGGGTNAQNGTARPASNARPTTGRPSSNQGHGSGRPGTRSTTPAQRTQERRAAAVKEKPTGPISIPPQIVVKDLAELLHATPNEIIRGLIKHSIFASINQVVEYEKAALVAQELGFEPSLSTLSVTPAIQGNGGLSANEAMMASRHEDNMVVIPPVVTIMGHVDHGKTSLLDTIRKTKVAAGEAGGITQHIGAYQIEINGKKITFLDTPGHEAFTAMRARGAQVTHIAVIVVAADDGVMPQTREAISHAQAAKVPIIIALNKIDKAGANPDHVKQQLADIGLVVEEYGGDIVCVPVSARKGTGIDDLLEMILLVAEVQDIKANPNRPATGVIIEAKLEKNTGAIATVLIQQGTLKMGDNIVVGHLSGKVRAMFNDRGKRIQKAPPSTPVSILGLPEVPNAGDRLEVANDERAAKQMATKVAEQRRNESMPLGQVSLDTLYMQMQEGTVKELDLVLKCDVQGSAEAIKNALTKVGEENIKVRLIHEGIGNISETDVHLAAASGAIIIGFNVKADGAAQRQAQKEGVDIRYYNVIYKLTDDIQAALTGMLEPTFREVIEGHAEVVQTFKAGKNLVIAGCRITDGKITRSSQARILRKGTKAFDGKIASLRRGKDDVREVATGYECGIVLEDFNETEVGDIIEAYNQERVKPGA